MTEPYPKNGKLRYNIAGREPWELPNEVLEIPEPPDMPSAPSEISLLMLLLPPGILITGSVVSAIFVQRGKLLVMLPMLMMGLGYPMANLINNRVQRKKYKQKLEERKAAYVRTLREFSSGVEGFVERQRGVMQAEFPPLNEVLEIGKSRGGNKRLWWRRPGDFDFLNLRLGTCSDDISFSVVPPRNLKKSDPLNEYPYQVIEHYAQVRDMPFLVDLKQIGSLVVFGASFRCVIRVIRRLLVDLIVHHSPEDVNLVLLANRRSAAEEWEWLKWAPHTHAVDSAQEGQNLLFTTDKINLFLDDLKSIFIERLEKRKNYQGSDIRGLGQSYVVVFDDERVRQHEDIRLIAEEGWKVGIYLVFVTDVNVPSTYRARIEVNDSGRMNYLETYESQGAGNQCIATASFVRKVDVEPLARALAGLEVAGGKGSAVLPSTVRVVDLIRGDPYNVNELVDRWRGRLEDSQQVMLPVGQYVDRDGLATYEIDFRPDSVGGKNAYHAMMIGTTGSGKSIFMQSLVLAAAHRYSPRDINFMFMDFKAGAAELKKVSTLPHSVGMVTDLSPSLADRALQALENELSRRKLIFEQAGMITDIWDYNRRFPDQSIPHLVVMVDEFAEGIKILPNLVDRLKELGRQGRAFGMYFFLANQEVNSAVDALKANVSWYVLLKVNRREEMSLIERHLPVPPGRGRGYVKVNNDITSIQSAYAGLPANVGDLEESEINEFVITTFGPDGSRNELFRYDPRQKAAEGGKIQTELDLLVSVIHEAANTLSIPPVKPIYTEPLDISIPIGQLIHSQEVFRLFDGQDWQQQRGEKNVVPLGYIDIPQRCLQPAFSLDFNEGGGHLWIIGTPGSGKNMTLVSLATILCLTHTPEDINLYVADFGNGQITILEHFPHTAAVIHGHESERVDRLIRMLQEEMRSRTENDWRLAGKPELYVLVNNVADMRIQYPDQADELGRIIRSGGAVGIHVVITSNRGSELPRSLSGIMTNRIVLQLTETQEFVDVLNTRVSPLTIRTEGRGYLFQDGEVAECQVALLEDSIFQALDGNESRDVSQTEAIKDTFLREMAGVTVRLGAAMRKAWQGERPEDIKAMTDLLSLTNFQNILKVDPKTFTGFSFPLGLYYDNLQPAYVDLRREGPYLTILGGRQSGKSTLLTGIGYFLAKHYPGQVDLTMIPFRRGPLAQVESVDDCLEVIAQPDRVIERFGSFMETVQEHPEKLHVLIIDDAGLAFSGGNKALTDAINQLGEQLNVTILDNFLIIIADLYSNLKSPQTYSSPFLRLFQQSQTGFFFSMDDTDMSWFNTRVSLMYKKTLKWLPGRGFFVSKGESEYVQCPQVVPGDLNFDRS